MTCRIVNANVHCDQGNIFKPYFGMLLLAASVTIDLQGLRSEESNQWQDLKDPNRST